VITPVTRVARSWRWLRLGPSEVRFRRVLSVPVAYPERVYGGDKEARRRHFRLWAAELAAAGLESASIIENVRREQGQ
jgi:hypothetical protein